MQDDTHQLLYGYLEKIEFQRRAIQERIIGMRQFIESLFICFYSHSERKLVPHLLVEGKVGQGKTATLDAFSKTIGGATFRRIQFTPDLRPLDLIRTVKQNPDRSLEFQPGPLIANLVLADEINRAHEKTRSALLEAMGEEQVTIEGATVSLERPFFVMATENPSETEGVYQLGAAQLDRFMMKVYTESLSEEEEMRVIVSHQEMAPVIQAAVSREEVLRIRDFIREHIFVHAEAIRYALRLVGALRLSGGLASLEDVSSLPEGTRAPIFLVRGAKVRAFLQGRTHVVPEDIDALAFRILNHRIVLRYGGDVMDYVASAVKVARENEYKTSG